MTFSPGFKHIWTNFYQLMKIPRETFVGVGEEDIPRGEGFSGALATVKDFSQRFLTFPTADIRVEQWLTRSPFAVKAKTA